jgi:hypothetical protein
MPHYATNRVHLVEMRSIVIDPPDQPFVKWRPRLGDVNRWLLSRELANALAINVVALVVQRYRHVEGVTGYDDIGGALIDRQSVERGVGFNEPAMLLGLKPG